MVLIVYSGVDQIYEIVAMSDSAETSQQKMDRRKKRTSTNQYMMYIELMEKDPIFATGRVPRDYDQNYLQRKWKELSEKLNACNNGPTLTSEEWRKVGRYECIRWRHSLAMSGSGRG